MKFDDYELEEGFHLSLEERKKLESMYTYKDGIALRTVDSDTSWESIYHSFYKRTPKEEVMIYIVRQINLYRDLQAYGKSDCSANENFIKAVNAYAKDNRLSFNRACQELHDSYCVFADRKFVLVLDGIISQYGFSEKALADMIGYDRSVLNKIRSGDRTTVPKKLIYALALFLDYDIEECEEFFANSPHPLHNCYPDNVFRAYVKSENRSLQPFIDICVRRLRRDNLESSNSLKKQQVFDDNFFKPECIYSYLVISDFETDKGYDFNTKRIKELKEEKSRTRRTFDDRLIVEPC